MRYAIFLSLLPAFAPQILAADDFALTAPATAATVFPRGATITRAAMLDVPQGTHRLLVPALVGANGTLPRIDVTGAALGSTELVSSGIVDGRTLFTSAQTAAYDAWRTAQEGAATAEDARIRAAAAVTAAEDARAFLRSVAGGTLDALDPAGIVETATAISGGIAGTEVARANAQAELRTAEHAVEEAKGVLAQARRDLDATGADFGPVTLLALTVDVAQTGPVTLTMEDFVFDAGWSTAYDAMLVGDVVTFERTVRVRQGSQAMLAGVALRLSTADPLATTAPTEPAPDLVALAQDASRYSPLSRNAEHSVAEQADLAVSAPAPITLLADAGGPVVAYDWPVPVDLPASGDTVSLTLETVSLQARTFNRAIPRTDETAFRMAEVINTTTEPLLAGPARLFRDGETVGETYLPLIPAGDVAEIAFGPQQHLRLEFVALDNETGDRGIFFASGTRQQDMMFRVRNLSSEAEVVETRFALPYSEEEDLEITVTARPAPDARDVEDKRGVAQWNLNVAGGAEVEVEIGVALEWPEGETLVWQP